MNEDLKNSVGNILAGENRDEMWEKFFNSVEYSASFEEALGAYKSLDGEITNLIYDIEDMQLGEEFELFKSIKEDRANLLQERENIQKVLDEYGDSLSEVHKESYMSRLSEISKELGKVEARKFKYEPFNKQRGEAEVKIKEKQEYLSKWYSVLEDSFNTKGGIKDQIILKAEEYNNNLDKEYNHLKQKLENAKKNLKYAEMKEEEMKKFGETSSQFISASEAKHNSMTAVINVENEIKKFKQNLAKASVDPIKFIHFLKSITFEEFFERLQKNGYDLKFGVSAPTPDGGSSTPDNVEPEPDRDNSGSTGTNGGDSGNGDSNPDSEPDKDKPESTGGDDGDGSGDSAPEDDPQEIEDDKGKKPEDGSGSSDSGKDDEEKEEDNEKNKWKDIAKKKVKAVKTIPAIVKDKVSSIVPSLKKFFKTTYENPITRNNNSMSISGLHLQQSLGNPVIGNSTLSVITAIADNEYVKNDKNLLGNIRENIRQGLMSKEDRDYEHYFEMYEKIMSLPDEAAKEWFGNVTIKDELMRSIKENCGLSKEQFNALLEKVGQTKVEKIQKEENKEVSVDLEAAYNKAVSESQERHKEAMNEVFGEVHPKEQQSYFVKNADAEEEWKKYYEEVERARLEASEEESHKHGR